MKPVFLSRVEQRSPASVLTLGELLEEAARSLRHQRQEALGPLGLSEAQYELLAALTRIGPDGPVASQAEVFAHARLEQMATSAGLRELAAQHLVQRVEHPCDKRAKGVRLTPAGAELEGRARDVLAQVEAAFFLSLGGRVPVLAEALIALLPSQAVPARSGAKVRLRAL